MLDDNSPSGLGDVVQPPGSPFQQVLQAVIQLAALFHDLGKANDAFQGMLRATQPAGQHMRHEFVSYLMLKSVGAFESKFLNQLSVDPAGVFASLVHAPHQLEQLARAFEDQAVENEAETLLSAIEHGDNQFVAAILYLVLTHHRQVAASVRPADAASAASQVPGSAVRPSLRRQLNAHLELSPENWQISAKVVPWLDVAWLDEVRGCATVLLSILENKPDIVREIREQPHLWAKSVALVARPTLIQADHLASASKEGSPEPSDDEAFANTVAGQNDVPQLADTLSVHLIKAQQASRPYFAGMEGLAGRLPHWVPASDSILWTRETAPSRFAWQSDAATLVAAIPDVATRPFFGMVISSTGAGKTLGGPKLLAAAAGGALRYTCALGLRSLTLQTGAAYRAQLDIADSDLLTVVGDALYAKLSGSADATANEVQGSESLDVDYSLVLDREPVSLQLASALGFTCEQADALSRGKQMAMTEAPVLVCTVDHLMGASALSTGADTRMSLRLATSDLILDEIDNYSLEDLQALGRLVHQVGCHGRRVIVMSATVSETVLQALYGAWRQGLAVWQFRTGATAAPVVALVSNQVVSEVVEDLADGRVSTAIPSFVAGICAALEQMEPRVAAKWLHLRDSVAQTFEAIYQQALAFAGEHRTIDPVTGKTVSLGFVRFNQVKHCRQFARFLFDTAKQPVGVGLKVQCYHRRMPLMHLTYVESQLNALLNRKDPQAIFAHPVISDWMAAAPDCRHYVVIVATTSIQETGRDHDYDFAIAEPWSTRSVVQLAGRVLRHRPDLAPTSPNIAVLDSELTHLEARGNRALELGREPLHGKNGQLVSIRGARGFSACTKLDDQDSALVKALWAGLAKQYPVLGPATWSDRLCAHQGRRTRTGWLPPAFFAKGIDARPCLNRISAAEGRLSYLEQIAQHRRMAARANPGMLSLADLTSPVAGASELLWNRHNSEIQFRRESGAMAQLTLDPAANFQRLVAVERNPSTRQLELKARPLTSADWRGGTVIKAVERALIPLHEFSATKAYERLGEDVGEASLSARLCHSFEVHLRSGNGGVGAQSGVTVAIDFDPLLGADTAVADASPTNKT